MKYGFTGSQKGLTLEQKRLVRDLLRHAIRFSGLTELHHGDCVGADEEVHGLAVAEMIPRIVIHPGLDDHGRSPHRSYCKDHSPGDGHTEIVELRPFPYLTRNQHIVDGTNYLLACPGEKIPKQRSGTWYTIRRGREYATTIIFPDGTVRVQ